MSFVRNSAMMLLTALSAGAAGQTRAALAPNFERKAELSAILDDPDVSQKLGMEMIQSITAGGQDEYRIRTSQCYLDVKVVDASPSGPAIASARRFLIKAGNLQCNERLNRMAHAVTPC